MADSRTAGQIHADESLAYYNSTTPQQWVPNPSNPLTAGNVPWSDAVYGQQSVQDMMSAPEGTYDNAQIQAVIAAAQAHAAQGPEALGQYNKDTQVGLAEAYKKDWDLHPDGHENSFMDNLMYKVFPAVALAWAGGSALGLFGGGAGAAGASGLGAAGLGGAEATGGLGALAGGSGAAAGGVGAAEALGGLGGLSGIGIAGGAPAVVSIGAPAAAAAGGLGGLGTAVAGLGAAGSLAGLINSGGGTVAPTAGTPQPGTAGTPEAPVGPMQSVNVGAPASGAGGISPGATAGAAGGLGAIANGIGTDGQSIPSVTIGPPTTATPAGSNVPPPLAAGVGAGLGGLLSTNPTALQQLPDVQGAPNTSNVPPPIGPGNIPQTLPIPSFGIPNVNGGPTQPGASNVTPNPSGPGSNPLGGLGNILGNLLGGNVDRIKANQDSDWWKSQIDTLMGMYKPGTPEANLMRQQMEAKDAATGRRSQYGIRETDLAAQLAGKRAGIMTSAGYQNMANAYRQRSSQDLAGLFGAVGANGGLGNTIAGIGNGISGVVNGLGGLFGGN